MGQSSIPILNRSGYSMFWASLWDSKFSFSKLQKQDLMFRKYITNIINGKISCRPLFFTDLIFKNIKKSDLDKFNLKFFKDISLHSFSKYMFRINKLPNFISKIRILRFQKWLVIYFKIFTPNPLRKIILKKKRLNSFKYFNKYKFTYLLNSIRPYQF